MSVIRQIKSYTDTFLSGTPIIVKFDNVTASYVKFYPTAIEAIGDSGDDFSEGVAGYADATLSGPPVAVQITTNGNAYYLKGYEVISTETESYAGVLLKAPSHYMAYTFGTPRVGLLTINGTPYYAKMYPYQVSSGIYDMGVTETSHDADYISIIYSPTTGNFPLMTAGGELQDSDFGPSSFDAAGTLTTHESVYNHTNYDTAYSWGNHAGLYSLASHTHPTLYATVNHGHASVYAPMIHSHTDYAPKANPAFTGNLTCIGNITANYSDSRLKTRLGNIQGALDKVLSLDGFYYHANELAQSLGYPVVPDVGVSAQQVQKVLPEAIAPAPIDPMYMAVRYERLIPLIIEAIKSLTMEVRK